MTTSVITSYSIHYTKLYETDDELNAKLAALAARNNKEQIRDNLLQVPFTQQYNLSVTGGTDNITSKLSVMFENDKNYFRITSYNVCYTKLLRGLVFE